MPYQIGKTLSLDTVASIFKGLIHTPVLYGERLSAECGRAMTEIIKQTSSAVAYKDKEGNSSYVSADDYITKIRNNKNINDNTAWSVVGKVGSVEGGIKAFDILVNKNHAMMVTHVYDDGTYDVYDYAGGFATKIKGINDIDLSKGYRGEVNGEEYYFPYLGKRTQNRADTGTWIFDKDENISLANSFSNVDQKYINEFEYIVRFQGETDFSQDAGDKLVSLMKDEQLKTRQNYKIENIRDAHFISMTDVEAFYADDRDMLSSTINKNNALFMAKEYYGKKNNSHITINIRRDKAKKEIESSKYYWGGSW